MRPGGSFARGRPGEADHCLSVLVVVVVVVLVVVVVVVVGVVIVVLVVVVGPFGFLIDFCKIQQ